MIKEWNNIYIQKLLFSITFILFFLVIFLFFFIDNKKPIDRLIFSVLDIGQGDAIFIQSPNNTQIMFDGGPRNSVLSPLAEIMPLGDKTIDAIVITNPDADHIGGFIDILKNYKVGKVFEPGTHNDSLTYKNLKAEIERQNIPVFLLKKGMYLDIGGGVFIDTLFPDRDVSSWDTNDGSVVARVVFGETSIMLTGDATSLTESIILKNNSISEIDSDILKVGHHGSKTSSSSSFIKTVSPDYAIISDGKNNKYGHPHKEVLSVLESFGVEIFRTDLAGTIVFSCDRIGLCEIKK